MVYGVGGEDKADSSSRINEELSRSDIPAGSRSPDVPASASCSRASCAATPGRPLLTWYDDGTGERVELSVTTYANWVAKAASLLVDEHDLERGDVLLVDLPNHWLGPVFLGAAWTAGLAVAFPSSDGDAGRRRVRPRVPGDVGAPRRRPAGARLLAAAHGRPLRRAAAARRARRRRRGVGPAGRVHAVRPTDGSDVALVDGPVTQDELFTDRTVGSSVAAGSSAELDRRRPAPVDGEPGFPTRCRRRRAAARVGRLAGPRDGGGPGPARRDRRGRAGHPPLRLISRLPRRHPGRAPALASQHRCPVTWVALRRSATRRLIGAQRCCPRA